MTPVQGWSEADYYRASRNARAACESRSEQLQLIGVLDEPQVSRADATAAACGSSSPPFAAEADSPGGGLAVPAEETSAHPPLPATEAARTAISVSPPPLAYIERLRSQDFPKTCATGARKEPNRS